MKTCTYVGDTGNHIVNVRFERVNSTGLLVAAEPHANSKAGTVGCLCVLALGGGDCLNFTRQVAEVFDYSTSGALNSNLSGADIDLNYFKNALNQMGESSVTYLLQGSTQSLRLAGLSFCLYLLY